MTNGDLISIMTQWDIGRKEKKEEDDKKNEEDNGKDDKKMKWRG